MFDKLGLVTVVVVGRDALRALKKKLHKGELKAIGD